MDLQCEQILEYQIDYNHLLGQGKFGKVFLAKDKNGNLLACKVNSITELCKYICTREQYYKMKERLQQEVYTLMKWYNIFQCSNHPNIAKYIDYAEKSDSRYLLSEYCDGQTLEQIIQQGRVQESIALPWIVDLIKGLNHIHKQQIIHRDIKPSNIMFNKGIVKFIDFGFAKLLNQQDKKMTLEIGAPQYMAPELLDLQEDYDQKVDVWALGWTFYQLLYGADPWNVKQAGSLEEIYNIIMDNEELKFPQKIQISKQLQVMLSGMLQIDPVARLDSNQLLTIVGG